MIAAIPLSLVSIIHLGRNIKSVIKLVGELGLNITLLQTWFPYAPINVSLNGVAWYLSVTLFLYFMFPYIARLIRGEGDTVKFSFN